MIFEYSFIVLYAIIYNYNIIIATMQKYKINTLY